MFFPVIRCTPLEEDMSVNTNNINNIVPWESSPPLATLPPPPTNNKQTNKEYSSNGKEDMGILKVYLLIILAQVTAQLEKTSLRKESKVRKLLSTKLWTYSISYSTFIWLHQKVKMISKHECTLVTNRVTNLLYDPVLYIGHAEGGHVAKAPPIEGKNRGF